MITPLLVLVVVLGNYDVQLKFLQTKWTQKFIECSLSPGNEESMLKEYTGPLGFTTRANTKGSIRNSLRSNDAGQIPRPRNCCKLLKANQSDYEP